MTIGASLLLIALGAILTFGVTASVRGLNVGAIGVILMVVGVLGMAISMLFWESYAPFAGWRRRDTVEHITTTHELPTPHDLPPR